MTVDDCYQLGHVVKTHGLKGHVTVLLDVDNPEYYQKMESFFLQLHGRMVPFFIESLEMNGNKAIIKLEDTDTPEKARELQG